MLLHRTLAFLDYLYDDTVRDTCTVQEVLFQVLVQVVLTTGKPGSGIMSSTSSQQTNRTPKI